MAKPHPINILVIGSGGREHAIVRTLRTSPNCGTIVCSPGNDGIAQDVPCIELSPLETLRYCERHGIGLVIIGPEGPLVSGLADKLTEAGIPVFGPSQKGAALEASKDFTKQLCDKYNIPTAAYATFDTREAAVAYVRAKGAPIVIKADGLAAGKGVTVATKTADAVKAVNDCFNGVFGEAGARVVIEECMEGEEVSFFALCDGQTATAFANAQDHKRAFDNDKGPNTGGMGTYSPTPIVDDAMHNTIMNTIILPTMEGLKQEGIPYVGVLFAGLMLTKTGPKLIEYNCRFGDPETQVMLARFNGDLAALLLSCARGKIDPEQMSFTEEAAVCVVMAAKGYPGSYTNGTPINGIDRAVEVGINILHAGTRRAAGIWVATGGRVLNVIGTGASLREARYRAYEGVEMIDWKDGFYRKDIAAKALQK